jgi:hypothetical protein
VVDEWGGGALTFTLYACQAFWTMYGKYTINVYIEKKV